MAQHENIGQSDEWYTPKYIFDALGCRFDLDVASPPKETNVPCKNRICANSLAMNWAGKFVWMNPPFGGRNGLVPWIEKFIENRNGIALTPDRTSAPWWQHFAKHADAVLFIDGKVKFIRPDGTRGMSPSTGTTLWAMGSEGVLALLVAEKKGLGKTYLK